MILSSKKSVPEFLKLLLRIFAPDPVRLRIVCANCLPRTRGTTICLTPLSGSLICTLPNHSRGLLMLWRSILLTLMVYQTAAFCCAHEPKLRQFIPTDAHPMISPSGSYAVPWTTHSALYFQVMSVPKTHLRASHKQVTSRLGEKAKTYMVQLVRMSRESRSRIWN